MPGTHNGQSSDAALFPFPGVHPSSVQYGDIILKLVIHRNGGGDQVRSSARSQVRFSARSQQRMLTKMCKGEQEPGCEGGTGIRLRR